MILNINCNDNDHYRNLLGDAIFQCLTLHSISLKYALNFPKNETRHIFLIIKGNEWVSFLLVPKVNNLRIESGNL